MQRIVTLTERKTPEAARRREAAAALVPVLAEYARAHGGRFLLYGSAARGQVKYHSDVDLLLDFPGVSLGEAWNFAETSCWDCGLEPDPDAVQPVQTGISAPCCHRPRGGCMSDARWFEIDSALSAAVRHSPEPVPFSRRYRRRSSTRTGIWSRWPSCMRCWQVRRPWRRHCCEFSTCAARKRQPAPDGTRT